jgi:ferrous iron transport protein B
MQSLFASPLAAFAYLVFILLYMPCVATVGAIAKELGVFWAAFSTIWSLVMAYTLAVIAFQLGRIGADPVGAGTYVAAMVALQGVCFAALLRWGRQHLRDQRLIPLVQVR